eukprot:scaffold671639_cov46-Prasinocladus_malaysianus.AAC.1
MIVQDDAEAEHHKQRGGEHHHPFAGGEAVGGGRIKDPKYLVPPDSPGLQRSHSKSKFIAERAHLGKS